MRWLAVKSMAVMLDRSLLLWVQPGNSTLMSQSIVTTITSNGLPQVSGRYILTAVYRAVSIRCRMVTSTEGGWV